jgi:hypothetical protein
MLRRSKNERSLNILSFLLGQAGVAEFHAFFTVP